MQENQNFPKEKVPGFLKKDFDDAIASAYEQFGPIVGSIFDHKVKAVIEEENNFKNFMSKLASAVLFTASKKNIRLVDAFFACLLAYQTNLLISAIDESHKIEGSQIQ